MSLQAAAEVAKLGGMGKTSFIEKAGAIFNSEQTRYDETLAPRAAAVQCHFVQHSESDDDISDSTIGDKMLVAAIHAFLEYSRGIVAPGRLYETVFRRQD